MLRMVAAARAVTATRMAVRPATLAPRRFYSGEELSDADFDAKWKAFFEDESHDARTIRRGLNDVFAYGKFFFFKNVCLFPPFHLILLWCVF